MAICLSQQYRRYSRWKMPKEQGRLSPTKLTARREAPFLGRNGPEILQDRFARYGTTLDSCIALLATPRRCGSSTQESKGTFMSNVRGGWVMAAAASALLLSGCTSTPQDNISSWYQLRESDPPTYAVGIAGFDGKLADPHGQRLTLRFRDAATKTHAVEITIRNGFKNDGTFVLPLIPRDYELYQFELQYFSHEVQVETGEYRDSCTYEREEESKHSKSYTSSTRTSTCSSGPVTYAEDRYDTYTSPMFSAPFRLTPNKTSYIGNILVQCDFQTSDNYNIAQRCWLNYGVGDIAPVRRALTKGTYPPLAIVPLDVRANEGQIHSAY